MFKKNISEKYYAVFQCSSDGVDVNFPDLPGCLTCGKDMEDAYEMAVDALAGWLEHARAEDIPNEKSTFQSIKKRYLKHEIMLIPVDKAIMREYEEKQRFNASFPKSALRDVDEFVQKKGWNRSQFLIKASQKFIAEAGL